MFKQLSRRAVAGPGTRLLFLLPLFATVLSVDGTTVSLLRNADLYCRLLADPNVAYTYIPSPNLANEADPWQLGIDGRAAADTTLVPGTPSSVVAVNVSYSNFTAAQQAAFQYAVDIWKSQLTGTVPIEIAADMASLPAGVLGSAGPTWLSQRNGSWHAIALANQLANADLAPGDSDIEVRLSSNFNWYLGTDGNVPAGRYDFVSVVLHELGHGLGFTGSMTSDGTNGSWGYSGIPVIYDRFTENGSAVALLTLASPSAALHAQLTGQGGGVFWRGSSAIAANAGAKPRLYSPGTFSSGSSYSHLNEATYPALNVNSLMTPQLSSAEAIHNPGPITLGMFADMGWPSSAGCSYSVSPTTASFSSAGGSGSVTITTTSGCAWTAVSNASSVLTITSSASGTGSGTVSYSVAANAGSARTGTMTIAGQRVTVSQSASSSLPTVSVSPATLSFAATSSVAGTLAAKTQAQEITLTQSGSGTVTWVATSDQPWLIVTSGTGTGTGRFTVSVSSASGLPASGTVSGTVTVTATGAQANTSVAASLRISAPNTAAPIGQVDTPLQNATGVQGAIGVTGWALDDVGVTSVKIYRNCLPAVDAASACQSINGASVVFIGDAAFVPGARADIESAFPSYPQNSRAGWGYLMLTNMLPNVSSNQPNGGQGPLTIYAFATDAEGNRSLLGRAWAGAGSTTPTSITMANASIAKPFGAIDTPSQGQTVSGVVPNFGWALTPDSNTVVGDGDIHIPSDGSTMRVVIDGVFVGTVTYNQCRGNVGNPISGGVFCNDDVSNVFGNATPQPSLTSRASNPTVHRNLDSGRSPIGSFDINTLTMTNGRHSIAWGVTDSAGRSEGIGSREFIVLNGSSLTADLDALADAAAMNVGASADVDSLPLSASDVTGRTSFDFERPLEAVMPDRDGVRHVSIPELGRLELWLGDGVVAGYLRANDDLRPLPPGSVLDASTGRFTWSPIVGYIGPYDLVFVTAHDARIPIRVTVHAKASEVAGSMRAHIDLPVTHSTVSGSLTVAGWALDPDAWQGSGVDAVHVWAVRRDVPAADPEFLGAAQVGVARPDVARAFGAQFDRAGWHLDAIELQPGTYDVLAYFWSSRTQRFEDARTVSITMSSR